MADGQSNAQAPGPPGWPHEAQASGIAWCGAVSALAVANTDSFLSSRVEWHAGHSGVVPERTSASNSWPHWGHAYS
jgi:hypothetical protein